MSLCKTCIHCMAIHIKNKPGGSGDLKRVVCLKYPEIFKGAGIGTMTEDWFHKVIKCNRYEVDIHHE